MENTRRLAEIAKGETLYCGEVKGTGRVFFTRRGRRTGRFFGTQLPFNLLGARAREVQRLLR